MNKVILERAIEQVRYISTPPDGVCLICLKQKVEFPPDTTIDILETPTETGIPLCRICFDNIQIAVAEISQEF